MIKTPATTIALTLVAFGLWPTQVRALQTQCATEWSGTALIEEEHAFFDLLEGDPLLQTVNTPLTLIPDLEDEPWSHSSLVVDVVNVNNDAYDDIVIGGSSGLLLYFLDDDASVRRKIISTQHIPSTENCYDFRIHDYDGDGYPDIAMARNTFRDLVLLHAGTDYVPGGLFYPDDADHRFELIPPDFAETTNPLSGKLNSTPTRGIWASDIDNDGDRDLILTGDKVRYWRWDPSEGLNGEFVFEKSYTVGTNRRVSLAAKLDPDAFPDLVVSGSPGVADAVWLNSGVADDPFGGAASLKQDLVRPESPLFKYQRMCVNPNGSSSTTFEEFQPLNRTYEFAVPDLDLDGDLDLVIATRFGPNAAYVNDGTGTFGCKQSGTFVPGEPAWIFPDVTAGWTGWDDCMFDQLNAFAIQAGQPALLRPRGNCTVTLEYPGEIFSDSTGVAVGNVAGPYLPGTSNHLPDIAFSNRNDIQQVLKDASELDPSDPLYCSHDTQLQPPVCDHVFINTTQEQDVLGFNTCVEMIMQPNDGTGYAELLHVDDDPHLDWVDANFSHDDEGFVNRVYWGTGTTEALSCTSSVSTASASGDNPDDLLLSFGAELAHHEFLVFASPTFEMPRFKPQHAQQRSDLGNLMAESEEELMNVVIGSGFLDGEGKASWTLDAGPNGATTKTLFISVAVLDEGQRVLATANTAIPLR